MKTPDKRSFILGMVTAFCECVAAGCKRLALSPPLTREDYAQVSGEAMEIIQKHGLIGWHEENPDQPEARRFDWILIAARPETIQAWCELRERGFSPMDSLEPFHGLLSYVPEESVHTGYDAYRTFFPMENHERPH